MSLSWLRNALVSAVFVATSSSAQPTSPHLLGIRPGMPPDAAQRLLSAVPGVNKVTGLGRMRSPWGKSTSKLSADASSEGTKDRIQVVFIAPLSEGHMPSFAEVSPAEAGLSLQDMNVVTGVRLERSLNPVPTDAAMRQALHAKYGQPSRVDGNREIWIWNAMNELITEANQEDLRTCEAAAGGVGQINWRTGSLPEKCGDRLVAEIYPYGMVLVLDSVSVGRQMLEKFAHVNQLAEKEREAAREAREVPKF